jgi:integrase/recombinase XerD
VALRRKKHNHTWNRKTPIEHTGFYPYLQRYLEYLQVRGFSDDTCIRHDGSVRNFAAWCEGRGLDTPQQITKPVLERYQKHLYYYRKSHNGEPLSFSSQKTILIALKSFFRWLTQQNYLLYNPASELVMPKPPRQLPRTILSVETLQDVLRLPDLDTPNGLRDRVVLEVLYGTAMRRTELITLRIYDVDFKRDVLVIRHGKGNKDRVLPLTQRVKVWLEKYLETARGHLQGPLDDARLFLTDYGEPFSSHQLGALVKRYLKRAGVDAVGSCHLFRHAAATHMLENGADIRFIQTLLGHDDLNSTQIYTHVSVEKLRDVLNATHPAKLNDAHREASGDDERSH